MAKVAAEVDSTASKYQILKKLAVGGMAEIFLARGASVAGVERYCVLKRILDEHASDELLVQMFVDEARLAAQLQHPNIASVYDFGTLGDSYFFTMEYVHGETVRSLIDRATELGRTLPLACVLTIIAGAAAGLHHAHERNTSDGRPLGIVHRDVSPSNLMVSYEGHVKVVDFGVAKAADRANETKAGLVKGKIGYLSPEQCRGAPLDRRSDLFSLGIVTWEMLTARRLYRREGNFENMAAIVTEPPPPPSMHRPDVPRELDDLVLRLLAKSPAARFQSAGEVVEAIEDLAMRAGTILSISAVSRLIRDLFGTRVEPWLAPDPDDALADAVTTAAQPITGELEVVELGVSQLIDLSAELRDEPEGPAGSGDDAAADVQGEAVDVQVEAGDIVDVVRIGEIGEIDPPSPPVRPSQQALASTSALAPSSTAAAAVAPEDAPTVVVAPILLEPESDEHVAAPATAPAPDADTTASTSPIVVELISPSAERTTIAPQIDPYGGPPPTAFGSEHGALPRAPPPAPWPGGAPRTPWPLVAVLVTAVVVGVGVAWLAMHRGPRRALPRADGLAVAVDAARAGSAIDPPAAPVESPAPPREGSARIATAPLAATFEALSAHYEARDYQSVVTACSSAASTTGITTICMMAACHLGDAVQAKRWLAAHPPERRPRLAATCIQLGNVALDPADLSPRRDPSTVPPKRDPVPRR